MFAQRSSILKINIACILLYLTQVVLGYLSKLVFLHFDRPDAVSSAFALSRAPPGTSVSERLGTCRIKEKRKIIPANQLKLPVSNFLI